MSRRSARFMATAVALVLLAGACGSSGKTAAPPPDKPITTTTAPVDLGCNTAAVAALPYHVAWAKQPGELPIYAEPGAATPTHTLSDPRLTDTVPALEIPLTFLITDEPETDDCQWIEVYLPERPNFSTGWIKRADVTVEAHAYRIEVHLADFNLKAFEFDQVVLDVPVAIAAEKTPTPGGTYYITELLQPPDPNGAYGPYAFGLSGHSDELASYNEGNAQLGIHGTNQPEKIGTQVSHGCIRLRNEDIETLVDKLDNFYGVPVQVFA